MARRRWIGTFVGLFAVAGGCQVVGGIEPDLVLAPGDEACTCVPDAPPGWEGPFLVRRSAWDGASGASCPDGLQGTAHYMSPSPPACTPCTCGDAIGGSCGTPKFRCWPSTDCTGNALNTTLDAVGKCNNPYGFQGAPPAVSCRITDPGNLQSNGTCTTSSGGEIANPTLFQEILSACALEAGDECAEGGSCAPPLEGGARLCVRSSGGGVCPDGWGGESLSAFASGQDTRSCGACTCQPQAGICEGGSYQVLDLPACNPGEVNAPIDVTGDVCVDVSVLADSGTLSILSTAASVLTGGCQPAGGAPIGAVVGEGAVKYCCR